MLDAVCRISDAIGASLERIPGLRAARASRVSLWLFTGALVVFLIFPVLLMIPVSFTARPDITWPPTEGTWRWYVRFLQDPLWVGATTRSLIVGVLSAGLSMLIGVPAAFALVRANLKGRGAILALIVSPLILPRIIIAVALFYLYARINLVGTSLGLVLGHTVVATPYVVITVMAVLRQFDRRLEHAAYTLGAGRAQTLLAITLPIIRPGLVSAFLFAFVTSFDELTIALFVSGGLSATLPKQMWDQAILGMSPTIAAASTLLVIVTAILVYFADRLVNSARART